MHPSTLQFRKSSYSANASDCVEVADLPGGGAALRDTKHRGLGHVPVAEAPAWLALLAVAKHDAL
ncbi:DUF397 domain-containing protein [Nocardiopsis sp. CNS-639]|uniref:DUF397 domain-containing protein n=1 Tax=Nocardiopsis sp. CNS-639 TaxID=1169153 RepID=UPI000379DAFC|nr:DUF397 domain-containing protein [Nocardiopsis sp. CNS-639]